MSVPQIKLTMLGAPGSGKTTLMHGMYAMLAAGVHGYQLFTADPDDHIDLMRAWETLYDRGELPEPTSTRPTSYAMTFNYGLDPLLDLDFVDFRGGAATESAKRPDAAEDIALLRERLADSDSIYLILDGQHVGDWIRKGCPAMQQAAGPMNVTLLGRYIIELFKKRRSENRPSPSLVVIVTKSDVLEEVSGMPRADAMKMMTDNMKNLVPFAYYKGVTSMICPVQLGRFGSNAGTSIDPNKVQPIFVHKPPIFSLMHYLTEQSALDDRTVAELRPGHTAARKELQELQSGFGAGFFRSARIKKKNKEIDFAEERIAKLQKALGTAQQRAKQLMDELEQLPIIKDGKEVR